jgi:hypothetical protein
MDSFCFNIDFYFLHTLALGGEAASPDFSSGIQRNTRPEGESPKNNLIELANIAIKIKPITLF